MNDLSIFQIKLKSLLAPFERVVADKGYKGDGRIDTPLDAKDDAHKEAMGRARARHETINGRFKNWGILAQKFRHHRDKHSVAFEAVVAISQIEIENGNRPFGVTDYEDPLRLQMFPTSLPTRKKQQLSHPTEIIIRHSLFHLFVHSLFVTAFFKDHL